MIFHPQTFAKQAHEFCVTILLLHPQISQYFIDILNAGHHNEFVFMSKFKSSSQSHHITKRDNVHLSHAMFMIHKFNCQCYHNETITNILYRALFTIFLYIEYIVYP